MTCSAPTGSLPITRNQFHGDWNYTLHPTHDTPEPTELDSTRALSSLPILGIR
jgi:hypothetical protein